MSTAKAPAAPIGRICKNLIKFPQVYIAFVLLYVHCFEKKNTHRLNESRETRLPKRLKCTIVLATNQNDAFGSPRQGIHVMFV